MNIEEVKVFAWACEAFQSYRRLATATVIEPVAMAIATASPLYKDFVANSLSSHLDDLRSAVEINAEFCSMVVRTISNDLKSEESDSLDEDVASCDPKVFSVLRQIAREWSSDGRKERAAAFGRLTFALLKYFPDKGERRQAKVLVPGCGLGRLPFELSLLGFHAVGNEFSAHMLSASQAILNTGLRKNQLKVFPYLHSRSHWRTKEDQKRSVLIPDVSFDIPQAGEMEMGMGDFFDMAADPVAAQSFQAIVTSFFIDAPFDFFRSLDAISNVAAIGGIWVNFGPLHWHSEMSTVPDGSNVGAELSLDDVLAAVEFRGWKILERESRIPTTYCSTHPQRMGRMVFDCEFWVAQKLPV